MDYFELVQLFCCLFMTGVIWFVQIVHYPLFACVGTGQAYYAAHQRRTSVVVLPPMCVELATALHLLYHRSGRVDMVSAGLLAVIWLSTFFLQVPCHNKLTRGYDPMVVKRLVRSNWIRTVAWSLRSGLLLSALTF